MASGTEYLTSNANIAYPFREDADGIVRDVAPTHGAAATVALDFLVDTLFMVPPDTGDVYLSTITDMGAGIYQFLFADESSNLVLQGDIDVGTLDAAEHYNVLTLANSSGDTRAKFVVKPTVFSAYLAGVTLDSYQLRLRFEERTINRRPPFIQSFDLYEELPDPPEPDTPGPISGNVLIRGGYNMDVPSALDPDDADTTTVEMTAVAGGGDGLVPCEETSTDYTKRFMRLVPDENGNIQLTPGGEDCYTIVPIVGLQSYQITGSCVACCSCEDYENTAKALEVQLEQAQAILASLDDSRDNYYEPGVTHYNDTIAPRYIGVKFQVNGIGGAPYGADPNIRSGSVNWSTLTAGVHNNGDKAVQPTELRIHMTSPGGYRVRNINWEYDSEGGNLVAAGGGPTYTLVLTGLPQVARGKRLAIYVCMYWPGPTTTDPDWAGTLRFTYDIIGGATGQELTDTVEFT